ncbi:hypothetical protein SNOG_02618 [Parastagonospora nodorum SN15]|uniref:Uncharacterized protein n=1 Tax=Phaeosphaeria nodorum (strain SN15 / ATCC MYA-4574 / FGSC 10173) TaxID=321614 RepID=Q0V046_PHANO|nr:hypothetical protein SNOG_02618 [Parastagonospora nodorum SN15]EAT89349.1 hypothetical protein SNOG_02618 [Parastagonospora nodorum SN15]
MTLGHDTLRNTLNGTAVCGEGACRRTLMLSIQPDPFDPEQTPPKYKRLGIGRSRFEQVVEIVMKSPYPKIHRHPKPADRS